MFIRAIGIQLLLLSYLSQIVHPNYQASLVILEQIPYSSVHLLALEDRIKEFNTSRSIEKQCLSRPTNAIIIALNQLEVAHSR